MRFARAHGLAIAAWLWAAAFLLATRTDPLRLNWGDTMSDSNVQTSGRYFAKYGFIDLRFTPVIDVGPLNAESLRYTHYPPLPDLVNGVQQRLFGEADISTFRILADVLILVSLVFFYRWVRALWGGVTANVALVLVATNFLWLQYADTIHHVPLYTSTGFATLHLAERWLEERKKKLLYGAVATTFLCMMASYDYFFFVPIAVAVTLWMKGHRLRDRAMRPLLAAVVGGFALALFTKFSLVAWSTGPKNLVDDFVFQLHERATPKHSADYRGGIVPTLFYRSLRFFTPVFFVVVATQIIVLAARLLRRGNAAKLPPISPLLLLLCGAPFATLFSQLLVEQYHPSLQFLPYYAVSTGAVVAWLWQQRRTAARVAAAAAIVLAVGWEARELVTFEKIFLHREDIVAVRALLAKEDRRNVIFTNSWVDAPIRFYFERHVLGIGQSTKTDVDSYLARFFDEDGSEPVHYVQFRDVDKAAFDKHLYGIFVHDHKWEWIADPAPHKAEIFSFLQKRSETPDRVFGEAGRLVYESKNMKVYVLDRAVVERARMAAIGSGETRLVDFNDDSSNKFKVLGLQFNEKGGTGPGHCWTIARQPKHYRFTMKGLMHEPAGPASTTAVLRFPSTPAHRTLRMVVLGGTPDQEVTVLWNGKPLGTAKAPPDWTELSFDVPKDAYDDSGFPRLEIRSAKANEYGLGVALRRIEIEPVDDASNKAP